jgi:hypothetical protein
MEKKVADTPIRVYKEDHDFLRTKFSKDYTYADIIHELLIKTFPPGS